MECDSSLVNLMYYQAQELVSNENILLQTLGFDVAIDHPHTHVVKCCQLVKGVLSFHIFHILDLYLATSFPSLWTMCFCLKLFFV